MPSPAYWEMSYEELVPLAEGGKLAPFSGYINKEILAVHEGRKPLTLGYERTDYAKSLGLYVAHFITKSDLYTYKAYVCARTFGEALQGGIKLRELLAKIPDPSDRACVDIGRLLGYSEADIAYYFLNRLKLMGKGPVPHDT